MIRVTEVKIKENQENQTISILAYLKAPRSFGLRDNKLVLEYPIKFNQLNNIGEAIVFSLLPIAYNEASNIALPQEVTIEPETQKKIDKICQLWNKWFMCNRRVKVEANYIESVQNIDNSRKVAQLFSGGVDSLATFKRHQNDVKYLIFYHGSDIALKNVKRFLEVKGYVQRFADKYNKELIVITTNQRLLLPIAWGPFASGCGMLGPISALSNYIDKIVIAAGLGFVGDDCKKESCGSHPDLDHLIGCQGIEIIHDGFEMKRAEKIKYLSRDTELLRHIRVCWTEEQEGYNCGVCEKCYRTTTTLAALGVNPKILPFPEQSLSLGKIADEIVKFDIEDIIKLYWCENLDILKASPANIPGREKLINLLQNILGRFYDSYKQGFSDSSFNFFRQISNWRKLEQKLKMKPDSLIGVKRFFRSLRQNIRILGK